MVVVDSKEGRKVEARDIVSSVICFLFTCIECRRILNFPNIS